MTKNLREFFPDRVSCPQPQERVISSRYPAFRVHAIDEEAAARIRVSATQTKYVKGCPIRETDSEMNMLGMVCACISFPDLHDPELQAAWGTNGADTLLQKMLLPGEYAELCAFVAELCGFDDLALVEFRKEQTYEPENGGV